MTKTINPFHQVRTWMVCNTNATVSATPLIIPNFKEDENRPEKSNNPRFRYQKYNSVVITPAQKIRKPANSKANTAQCVCSGSNFQIIIQKATAPINDASQIPHKFFPNGTPPINLL